MRATNAFLPRRVLGATLSAVILGTACGAASLPLHLPSLPAAAAGIAAGFIVGWLSSRLLGRSVSRRIRKDHARWLVSDETVLVIQAPADRLHAAVSLLREGGDVPPAVYVQHPKRATPASDFDGPRAPLPPSQVRENAGRLALGHAIGRESRTGTELYRRLDGARQEVRDACRDLTEAVRMELATPPTAEWILDNEYVLESNARDVRANLPLAFVRQLPRLQGGRSSGLPRIYDIARQLVTDVELRLDKENISSFIDAYQAAGPLAIGELWALPQMLRIAIIENIRALAARAAAELHEREIADFWAGRLIRANRRSPEQLFAILAELSAAQPAPSAYLAGQLVGSLYDEEAALVLVQGWLERAYHQPLREINLREQNRQTRDQITVGNAFASLRRLALLDWRQIFEHTSRVEQALRGDPAGIYPGMDFDTRDRYRRMVEELSRLSGLTEDDVTRQAIALATEAVIAPGGDTRRRHVGTYLVGDGGPLLARRLRCQESARQRRLRWISRHATAVYLPAVRRPDDRFHPRHFPGRPAGGRARRAAPPGPSPAASRQPARAGAGQLPGHPFPSAACPSQDGFPAHRDPRRVPHPGCRPPASRR